MYCNMCTYVCVWHLGIDVYSYPAFGSVRCIYLSTGSFSLSLSIYIYIYICKDAGAECDMISCRCIAVVAVALAVGIFIWIGNSKPHLRRLRLATWFFVVLKKPACLFSERSIPFKNLCF